MKEYEQLKALALLDGKPVPHKPTDSEIASGSYYQFEPDYLKSSDTMRRLIEKFHDEVKLKMLDTLGKKYRFTYQLMLAKPQDLAEALLRATGNWKDE